VKYNYPIIDLKGLTVIWAVKKLKRYLRNILFTIITDHSALKHIFGMIKFLMEGGNDRWSTSNSLTTLLNTGQAKRCFM